MECSRPLYTNRPSGSAVIKPGNVWMTSVGIAKIGDFGMAVGLDRSRLTTEGMTALNLSSKNAHSTAFSQDTASNAWPLPFSISRRYSTCFNYHG